MNIYDIFDSNPHPNRSNIAESRIEIIHEYAVTEPGDSGDDDMLFKYARMWWNGDVAVQQQIETILGQSNWGIGEVEDEDGGVFVVQNHDENGDSYVQWTPEELNGSRADEDTDLFTSAGLNGVAEGYVDLDGPIENTPQVVWWRKTQGGNNIYWKVFPTLSTASRARENLANSLYKKYGKNFTIGNAKFDPTDPAQARAVDADRYMMEQVLRGPLSRDARRELVAPTDRDTVRRELWKYVGSLDQEGMSNRAHAMAHSCPTWGRLYHQFNDDVSQLLSRAPTEQLAQALQEIQSKFQGVAEGAGEPLSVEQLAMISDAALDSAYGYGRSTPGNTFGWQANLKSAAYAKKIIDAGITDVEQISDAIHKGWNVTAQTFVKNPMMFDDSKTMAPEKLQAKIAQRQKLMTQNYAQLPEEEKEKDRVVARAMLQAITGEPGVAEAAVPSWLEKNKQVRHEGLSDQPCTVQGREGGKVVIRDWTGKLFKVLATALTPVTEVASEDSNMPVAVDSISPIHGESKEAIRQKIKELEEHIGKVKDGYRLYSGKGKNLGTFDTKAGAEKHEREVQYFKHKVNELSKGTLGNYVRANANDQVQHASHQSFKSGKNNDKYNTADAWDQRTTKREKGMDRALNKLTKESLDEAIESRLYAMKQAGYEIL